MKTRRSVRKQEVLTGGRAIKIENRSCEHTNANETKRNVTAQRPEMRPYTILSSPPPSITIDLTDNKPPSNITTNYATLPVKLEPSQNLMPKYRPQFTPNTSNNSARESKKVNIPIIYNNPKPGVGENFAPTPTSRPPVYHVYHVAPLNCHPPPLPDSVKQYQRKFLPPAPDLKLLKVADGIVISWKFEGYPPDAYKEVASYQLYFYLENPWPSSTVQWTKIGDIKAQPLPMAYIYSKDSSEFSRRGGFSNTNKLVFIYYFAIRAIDVRSQIGPFSLPESIKLMGKI